MKWGQDDFFLLIQTLPTFWAERNWILRILSSFYLLNPKFLDYQVPRFPKIWPGPGRASALGRVDAQAGPRVGRAGLGSWPGPRVGLEPWAGSVGRVGHCQVHQQQGYLIPGCVGREVRLGSEISSRAGGYSGSGDWKSGNQESNKHQENQAFLK